MKLRFAVRNMVSVVEILICSVEVFNFCAVTTES